MNDVSELFSAIERLSDTNDVVVGIDSFARIGATVELRIRLNFDGELNTQQAWRVECQGVLDYRFVDDCWGEFELNDEHPMRKLWSEPYADLYFAAAPSSPAAVAGELIQIVYDEFGDWISSTELLPIDLIRCISFGFGKLCTGPASTVSVMEGVLLKHGMKPSHLSTPARWKPSLSVPVSPSVLAVGRSFVVAEGFGALRLQ